MAARPRLESGCPSRRPSDHRDQIVHLVERPPEEATESALPLETQRRPGGQRDSGTVGAAAPSGENAGEARAPQGPNGSARSRRSSGRAAARVFMEVEPGLDRGNPGEWEEP